MIEQVWDRQAALGIGQQGARREQGGKGREMEQKNNSVFKKVSIVYFIGMGLYIAGYLFLGGTNLEYRMWVSVLGSCSLFLGLPVWLFILWFRWHVREEKSVIFRYAATAVFGVSFLLWCYFVFLGLVFGLQEERRLFDGYVVVNRVPALTESQYDLCRTTGLFFRKDAEWTTGFEIEYLEKKYRQDFVEVPFDREKMLFYDAYGNGSSYGKTVPVSAAHRNQPVNVVLAGGALDDDYIDLLTRWYIVEGCETLGIDRSYQIEEDGNLCLYFADGEDMRKIAADMKKLMAYASQDAIFEEYAGTIRLAPEDAQSWECIYISFGNTNGGRGTSYGYDNDLLELYIEQCYEKILANREERRKTEEEWERRQGESGGAEEDTEEENGWTKEDTEAENGWTKEDAEAENGEKKEDTEAENSGEEEHAESIYEKQARLICERIRDSEDLPLDGEEFRVEYNAKGGEYYPLGEDGTYSYTLLYDRDSENGACCLYVLYRSPYDAKSGAYYHYTDTMTQIVDIYAVVKGTEKIIPSGRKSWSDPGNSEYRKATGE